MDLSWGSSFGVGFVLFGAAAVLWAISKLVQAGKSNDSKDD